MGLFDFLFRSKSSGPPPIPVPKERLWVGDITGLILAQIGDSGIRGIETWTVVIDEQFLIPGLFNGAPPSSETGRRCTLGECKSLQAVIDASQIGVPFIEPMVQALAFEVCRHAEPKWDELIDRYYARAYGREYIPRRPKDLDATPPKPPPARPRPISDPRRFDRKSILDTLDEVLRPPARPTNKEGNTRDDRNA